ncbi:30S ribosomal protein S12 methylthiotransferase RimO [Oscillospiraceae bacterium LTW-04]|nr:30S ribosomal protein S12 methylthiotransferase RimO [Oscillospiraceae bacterium MB24-C1]
MTYKVGMISLGCSKNQVDAEHMLAELAANGFAICNEPEQCDAIIVNTCGFIEDAKRESIENIFEAAQQKKNKLKALAVTGCLAERYQQEFAAEVPEADVILGMGAMGGIAKALRHALEKGERIVEFGDKAALPLEGKRILANAPYFAYLKVAEGCDNRCSFCSIPDIRGHFRSRKMEDIIEEAKQLAEQGVVELNVVAQDTTRYGQDIYGKLMLPELLRELCKIEKLHWIRVLYCYPDRTTDALIEVIANEPKIVKYIDLPLQHSCDTVLKRMLRRGDSTLIGGLLQKLRDRIPGVVIRTTMIAGLPGETEEEFEHLCNFVRDQAFERLGCFAYSQEEETPAGKMPDQVEASLRRHRADTIMEIQMGIANEIARACEGRVLEVLCEGYDDEAQCYVGRSYMDAPDIDTKVYFVGEDGLEPGQFVSVEITGADGYDLTGEQVD